MPGFDIHHRDAATRARTGTLRLAHGEVRTPAFVPLATKAVVKTLEVSEAADLGYDMVLGNTFHLFLTPGHELIRQLGGLHRFMRWDRPVITDSGGFQVFSMGHGAVADEIKGRQAHGERTGSILEIAEEGVRFRSYLDGSEQFMAPETSMEIQAALHSDIALVFDECTPFNVTRDYTAALDRAHAPLARPLPRLARRARPGRPAGLRDRPGRRGGGPAARVGPGGRRPRPGRDRDRRHAGGGQAADVRGRRLGGLRAAGLPPPPPARDRRDRRPPARRRARHRHVRLRDADPHRPPRDGDRAGPGRPLAGGPRQGPLPRGRRADPRRLPVPGLRARLLARVPALPAEGPRVDRVKAADDPQPRVHPALHGRAALGDRGGRLGEAVAAARGGAAPWELATALEGRVRSAPATTSRPRIPRSRCFVPDRPEPHPYPAAVDVRRRCAATACCPRSGP